MPKVVMGEARGLPSMSIHRILSPAEEAFDRFWADVVPTVATAVRRMGAGLSREDHLALGEARRAGARSLRSPCSIQTKAQRV